MVDEEQLWLAERQREDIANSTKYKYARGGLRG